MEKDDSVFHIPSYARPAAYTFATLETNDIYHELAAISEEILQCRSKILQNI